ncbi:DE Adenylate cyclase associated [Cooperia oncophora]
MLTKFRNTKEEVVVEEAVLGSQQHCDSLSCDCYSAENNLSVFAAPTTVDADKGGRDALFAEINKGEAITAGLRRVTADMQTHKNPALREHPSQDNIRKNHPEHPSASKTTVPIRNTPRVELKDGKQWNVEFIVGNPSVVVNVANKKQTVYIYKCEDSVIAVKGKLNSITLDSCRKTSVVFDAVVAQCETINCQRVEIQTLGEMPTISIQKTDGCQVYLSESSKDAEIVTSKSSEMNVLIPKGDGDYIEFPIPEQFKTTFDGRKLVTCVSDIS